MPATATKTEPLIGPPAPAPQPLVPIGGYAAKYRFESTPGHLRGLTCLIDWRPDWWTLPSNDPERRVQGAVFLDAWERRWEPEERELLRRAYLDRGSTQIVFTYERGPENVNGDATTGYVWFATDSDALAWVIRFYIEKAKHEDSDFRFIHEVARDEGQRLRVGDSYYATTEIGKRLAMEDSIASGTPIEPVAAHPTL